MPNYVVEMPQERMAGLPFSASVSGADYAAPDWALTLHLRGPAAIDIPGIHDGADHTFKRNAAETASWAPGRYWWAIRAVREGSDVIEVEAGEIAITRDMLAADAFDGRSEAETALDAINAVLAKRATLDQERYRINNRELYRMSVTDLMKLRSHFVAQVARERRKAAGQSRWGRTIPVRFS